MIKDESTYQQLLKCCEYLGIGDMRRQLEEMMVVDYLIANTDRHWGNFGFIRDANTLEWKGFAPIFDSGNSLWFDKRNTTESVLSETFERTQDEQIKLITDLSWYEEIPRKELEEIVMSSLNNHLFMDEKRKTMITEGLIKNAETIMSLE